MKETTKRIRTIEPKNKKQKEFISAIADFPVVLATGAAGSGKTFLATYKALESLSYAFVNRIVVVRPIVATEDIGFLPGDMKEKIDPYLLPIMDAFTTIVGPKNLKDLLDDGAIEIAALAFMRGRTLSDCFIILDEAQNTTISQMEMFMTRFGENVKVVITGDTTQSDIKGKNGLQWAIETFSACKSIAHIKYEGKDVVRSSLVRDILFHIEKGRKNGDKPTLHSSEVKTGSDSTVSREDTKLTV